MQCRIESKRLQIVLFCNMREKCIILVQIIIVIYSAIVYNISITLVGKKG